MSTASDENKTPLAKESRERHLPRRSEIEEMIQDAIVQGKFDNLPGKGKPLQLRKNVYEEETELAHKLLKDNDITLPWIAERSTLVARVDVMREQMAQQWRRYADAYGRAPDATHQMALALDWSTRVSEWEEEIATLNKAIDDFNLTLPVRHLELFKLNLERELARVGGRRELSKE